MASEDIEGESAFSFSKFMIENANCCLRDGRSLFNFPFEFYCRKHPSFSLSDDHYNEVESNYRHLSSKCKYLASQLNEVIKGMQTTQ